MAELIDRGAAMKCLEELDALMKHRAETEDKGFLAVQAGITLASCEIEALPTVDAVPVVRCKDCCRWERDGKMRPMMCRCGQWSENDDPLKNGNNVYTYADDFCGKGKRMDADAPERGREDLHG